MLYKALISFTGLISMAEGDVREISDVALAKDLVDAKYIEEVEKKETKAPTKRKGKAKK